MSVFFMKKERVQIMKETKIKLGVNDVHEFVKAATKCDFDIDVKYNRVMVDAKSILGILSMDLGQVLTILCYGESPEFNRVLQRYAVA